MYTFEELYSRGDAPVTVMDVALNLTKIQIDKNGSEKLMAPIFEMVMTGLGKDVKAIDVQGSIMDKMTRFRFTHAQIMEMAGLIMRKFGKEDAGSQDAEKALGSAVKADTSAIEDVKKARVHYAGTSQRSRELAAMLVEAIRDDAAAVQDLNMKTEIAAKAEAALKVAQVELDASKKRRRDS